MKTPLTTQQIETYRRDGCLIVEDFLTPDELAELDTAVMQSVSEMGNTRITDESAIHMRQDEGGGKTFLQRLNLWRINDSVKKLLQSPELGEMLCNLEGIDGIRV